MSNRGEAVALFGQTPDNVEIDRDVEDPAVGASQTMDIVRPRETGVSRRPAFGVSTRSKSRGLPSAEPLKPAERQHQKSGMVRE